MKLAFLMLHEENGGACDIVRSRMVTMGRWSAFGGRMLGFVLQEIMRFVRLFDLHTLSGLVQLPATDLYVGLLGGRARIISNSCMVSIKGSIRWGGLNNL